MLAGFSGLASESDAFEQSARSGLLLLNREQPVFEPVLAGEQPVFKPVLADEDQTGESDTDCEDRDQLG